MEATCLYDYQSTDPDGLSFHANSVVKILDPDSDPNWYKAEMNGKDGYVPHNYVAFDRPLWYLNKTKQELNNILSAKVAGRSQHPDGAFFVRPSQDSPGDMSLTVRIRDNVQHFRILRNPTRNRYFLWSDAPQFESITKLVEHYRHSSVSKQFNVVLRDAKLPVFRVDYDYSPQNAGELEIHAGEMISVLKDSEDGWLEGQIIRDGVVSSGFFPANYGAIVSK